MNAESILLLLSLLMADESITLPHPGDYWELFCEHHEDPICNAEKRAEIEALRKGAYLL